MARNDGVDRTSVRNLAVSDKAVGNTQQHNEREKDSYRNPDIIPIGKMICLSTFSTTLAASTVTPFNRYEFACILTFPMRAIGTSLQIVL